MKRPGRENQSLPILLSDDFRGFAGGCLAGNGSDRISKWAEAGVETATTQARRQDSAGMMAERANGLFEVIPGRKKRHG
jgi:hypothetical protein